MSAPVIKLRGVRRAYGSPPTVALANVDLTIHAGEMVAIVGPSGSGKSTLLNLMGTLDRATAGQTWIAGEDITSLSDADMSALRAHSIGFVFQQFHLADGVSAVVNVATGLLYTGASRSERKRRALAALEKVGLGQRASHRPSQLSGGERQRVAIARAIVGDPKILFADEPTGSLDTRSGAMVVEILRQLNAGGTTVVIITHDVALADGMPRRVSIRDGHILGDSTGGAS